MTTAVMINHPKMDKLRSIRRLLRGFLLTAIAASIVSWFTTFSDTLNTIVARALVLALGLDFSMQTFMRPFWRLEWPVTMQGYPVRPSGKWVQDDTPLTKGMQVLVFEKEEPSGLYRATVLKVLRGGWVRVRYVGWSKLWDAECQRSALQLDVGQPNPSSDPPETAIRAG